MASFTLDIDIPPGLVSDTTTYDAKGQWADASNVRFRLGRPESLGRYSDGVFTGVGPRPTAIMVFRDSTFSYFVFGSSTKLSFGTSGGGAAVTNITPSPAPSSMDNWTLAIWGRTTVLANPAGGKLYEWSPPAGAATAVGAAPSEITTILVTPQRQVLALGCNEELSGAFNGLCIRGSDLEDFTDWTTSAANNAFEHILDHGDAIVAAALVGSYVAVWTTTNLWLGQFIGDPGQTYRFDPVAENCGLVGPNAFAVTDRGAFWIAHDRQLYRWVPGGQPVAVPCPIRDDFLTHCADTASIVMGTVTKFGEIWIFYPDSRDGSGAGVNTRAIVYCANESEIAQRPVWTRGGFGKTVVLDDDMLHSTVNFLGSSILTGAPNGTISRLEEGTEGTATSFAWSIQSADQYIESGRRRVMLDRFVPDFEQRSGIVSLSLHTRDQPLSTPSAHGPYSLIQDPVGMVVDDIASSGDTALDIHVDSGGLAAGRAIVFAGVNGWADGADTGELAQFVITADFSGSSTVHFTPALISSGGSRNIVTLPANGAAVTSIGAPATKTNVRASSLLASVKFSGAAGSSMRLGKPTFDCITMGRR